jgi:hypothetical protein
MQQVNAVRLLTAYAFVERAGSTNVRIYTAREKNLEYTLKASSYLIFVQAVKI